MRYLTSEDVSRMLPMSKAIELVRAAFTELGADESELPVRQSLSMGSTGKMLVMPASLGRSGAGMKLITVVPGNADKGMPISSAVVIVADPDTGSIRAIIEAESLTAIRTGAGSGLATDLMAPEDSRVAAIFGAGGQAETQLEAIVCVRPITQALVFNRTRSRAVSFAKKMTQRLGIDVVVAETMEQLRDVDVVCTATSAGEPVLHHQFLGDRVHINCVGAYTPATREVTSKVVARSFVVADQMNACMKEAGDILLPIKEGIIARDHVAADLNALLTEKPINFRDHPWTLFKSVGVACQDVAVGHYLANLAEENDLGFVLPHG